MESDLPEIYVTTSVCTGWTAKNNAAKNDRLFENIFLSNRYAVMLARI